MKFVYNHCIKIWIVILSIVLILLAKPLLAQTESAFRDEQIEIQADTRIINFAGWQWLVKSGCGRGPGHPDTGNCWSDSEESAWVENGKLHLKLRKIGDTWHSVEVYTLACTQHGIHRFYIEGPIDNLDKNVVFALFLYKDDNTEIDMEFAKWGEDNPTTNSQYVVQPYNVAGNLESFQTTLSGTLSTHYINWTAPLIEFKSIQGHHEEEPSMSDLIHTWTYTRTNNIPAEGDCLKIHINLWSYMSEPPANNQEVEMIVANGQFPEPNYSVFLPIVFGNGPSITVTASGDQAQGSISPSSYCNANYKVALYAKTDIWYVQPSVAAPLVNINSNCTWQSFTNRWNEVAAHLVHSTYSPPSTIGGPPVPTCPPLTSNVLAASCYP